MMDGATAAVGAAVASGGRGARTRARCQVVDRQSSDRQWELARREAERAARAEVASAEALLSRLDQGRQGATTSNAAARLGTARLALRQSLHLSTWRTHLRSTNPARLAALTREIEGR